MADDLGRDSNDELYSNFFRVGYNAAEFLLDFGRRFENQDEVFYRRIITSPMHASLLMKLLGESLRKYMEQFGPICSDSEPL